MMKIKILNKNVKIKKNKNCPCLLRFGLFLAVLNPLKIFSPVYYTFLLLRTFSSYDVKSCRSILYPIKHHKGKWKSRISGALTRIGIAATMSAHIRLHEFRDALLYCRFEAVAVVPPKFFSSGNANSINPKRFSAVDTWASAHNAAACALREDTYIYT